MHVIWPRQGYLPGSEGKVIEGYSWWGVGKVEPGPELFFLDSGPDSTFCIC